MSAAATVFICCCCLLVHLIRKRQGRKKKRKQLSHPLPAVALQEQQPIPNYQNPMKTFRPPVKDIEMTTPVSSSFVTVQQHERTKTQLPENWAKDKDVDGNKYYYHKNSGETSWVAPNGSKQVPDNSGSGSSNAHNRNKTVMPTGWSADYDANSDKFYIDPNGNMQWEKPPQSNGI